MPSRQQHNILDSVTIFRYLAVAVAELDYFETRDVFLLHLNADFVLQTCFRALRYLVRFSVFDSFFSFVAQLCKTLYILERGDVEK